MRLLLPVKSHTNHKAGRGAQYPIFDRQREMECSVEDTGAG